MVGFEIEWQLPGTLHMFFGQRLVVATPHSSSISLTEKSDGTGRTLITLQSKGDIGLSAPEGRVHIKSKFFSREIG
jgi:hypothetical protein